MCGIAGYVGKGSSDSLRKMARAIERRGPDDEGFYEAPGVGFGFRRLSIIDVAGGHQPLSNEDGTVWVMLNGEIYGYGTLRDELAAAGHQFKTKSDTEVIAHAYEEWGDQCFAKLNGMFAIALWDAKHLRLVLARDRMGKKPLYWTEKQGTLWFGSELKALLAAGVVDRTIDPVSLAMYFRTESIPTPRSIFREAHKLEPATCLAWSNGGIEKTWRFWSCPTQFDESAPPEAVVDGLRSRLDHAVKERLVADVPLGLFLSGGLDSAVVAESAARQASAPLKAFTIGFDDPSHDERPAARLVAKALGLEHHEEMLTADGALGMLDEAVAVLDEPLADPSILPQLLLSQFTRKEVTVALSGDGGDELLLGYQHIPAHVLRMQQSGLPQALWGAASKLANAVPAGNGYFSLGFKAQRFSRGISKPDPWERDAAWRGACTRTDLDALLLPSFRESVAAADPASELKRFAGEIGSDAGFWRQWSWAYLRTFLMDDVLVKVDRATMWFALEARAPLLDHSVVSYLLSLPDSYKLGAWKNKRLFKELLRRRVPDSILGRPKHGFGIPTAAWLTGPLAERVREVSDPGFLRTQGVFNPETVQRFVQEHAKGRPDRRKELWAFLMFQLWYRAWATH